MIIDSNYLVDNGEIINENVSSFEMITGAYALMESDEIDSLRDTFLEESLDKFIAFSHVIDGIPLDENMVNYVNSRGERGIRKSRKDRSTFGYKTTGVSKFKRREVALKASKTRMSRPSSQTSKVRKSRKANMKRGSLGFDHE